MKIIIRGRCAEIIYESEKHYKDETDIIKVMSKEAQAINLSARESFRLIKMGGESIEEKNINGEKEKD